MGISAGFTKGNCIHLKNIKIEAKPNIKIPHSNKIKYNFLFFLKQKYDKMIPKIPINPIFEKKRSK